MADKRQLAKHIDKVAKQNGIHVVYRDYWTYCGGLAIADWWQIIIRPVRSPKTYAYALHEIGHLLGSYQYRPTIYTEAFAWQWAHKNALVWTESMSKLMRYCLGTYLDYHVGAGYKMPPDDHKWWQIYSFGGDGCDVAPVVRK